MSHLAPHVPDVPDHDVSVIGDSEHVGHLPFDVETDPVILVPVSDVNFADNLTIDASKTDFNELPQLNYPYLPVL